MATNLYESEKPSSASAPTPNRDEPLRQTLAKADNFFIPAEWDAFGVLHHYPSGVASGSKLGIDAPKKLYSPRVSNVSGTLV